MKRRNFLALTGAAAVCPIGRRPEGKMRVAGVYDPLASTTTFVDGTEVTDMTIVASGEISALSESAGRTQMSIAGRFAEIAAMLTIETGDGSPLIDDDLARELMETPA